MRRVRRTQRFVWCSVDFSFVELVTLAQVHIWTLGHSKLADVINADIDPHNLFAAGMTNDEYERFTANKKKPKEAGYRQAAKAANFGFPGMMGAPKFVEAKKKEKEDDGHGGERTVSVCRWIHRDEECGAEKIRKWGSRDLDAPLCKRCVEEADKLKRAYLLQWPDMKPYWDWVTSHMGHGDRLEQFVSKRVRGGLSAPAAANTLFQGLAADGAKAGLIRMSKEMYLDKSSPLFGSRLMVFAHDEIILEIPEELAHDAANRQAEIMIEEMRKFTPDVKIKAEPALMTRWHKQAEPVFDANGRLTVWEPNEPKAGPAVPLVA